MHIYIYIYIYVYRTEMRCEFAGDGNKMSGLKLEEHCEKLFCLMDSFWEEIAGANVDLNWLVKVRSHLDKIEKEQEKFKRKKLSSLSRNSSLKKMVFERFNEHLPHFQFKSDYYLYCNSQCPDFENLYTLLTINKTYKYRERVNATSKTYQDGTNLQEHLSREKKNNDIVDGTENPSEPGKQYQNHQGNNNASLNKTRLEGKFVSKNVINLPKRNLSRSEISLLSKGLKFVPSANKIDRAKLKRELEEYGRKLRLIWHFRNDERTFSTDKFRPKSSFNPRNKDAIIETYLSSLEERLLDIEIPSRRYNNLTKEERDALYSLRDDSSIIIKGVVVVVWDREDYLKEAYKQLEDREVYGEVPNDPSVLVNTIIKPLEKIRLPGDLSSGTLNYFVVEDPKFTRFYLLPKIHKRLHNVPGRKVISNCGFYTENISSFLDYHLQPLAQKVKSYIKDTNHFLIKIKKLGSLPDGAILCTMDVVGLYPNIPHGEGLNSLRRYLETRDNKQISSDTLTELAEVVLKNNIFEFDEKTFKQKRGTAIGTKFAPPYAILFMANLEEKILEGFEKKPMIWWRYIDDIFFIWEHGEESLKVFIEQVNMFHSTIKFTAEYSKEEVNFLDVNIKLIDGELKTDLFVKPTDTH